MPSAPITIGSTSGLHARPASLFAQAAAATGARVTIATDGGKTVNAASILALLTLGAGHGETVTLTVDGGDADAAFAELSALLASNLDEA